MLHPLSQHYESLDTLTDKQPKNLDNSTSDTKSNKTFTKF
jgi:hypothetical protein